MRIVGPTTNTKTARISASTILMLDSIWTPLAMPETADRMNAMVSTVMMPTSKVVLTLSIQPSTLMPLPIWSAPRPSEAAEPKRVAKIARMSMTRPPQPFARHAADQGCEHRAHRLPPPPPEAAVRDGQTHDRIDGPWMQRPVEQRGGHRGVHRLGRVLRIGARRRRGEVPQRFTDAVEHQADAHARAEHHRDPRHGAEFGLLALRAERDPAVLADRQPDREDHKAGGGEHERPAEVVDHPVQHGCRGVLQ